MTLAAYLLYVASVAAARWFNRIRAGQFTLMGGLLLFTRRGT